MEGKLFYPAVFHKEGDGYWVSFPDVPEALTEGDNMQEAYKMAVDCLGLALTVKIDENVPLPTPSVFENIELQDNEFLVVVEFDFLDYKKQTSSRAVKKTLSIPEWLNKEALDKGINFSQVLQEALIEKLRSL
ncbi:type II toxin-antitoxin system HicB family antitoxin [Erysipelotrichaceae bacterium HCN-30851]